MRIIAGLARGFLLKAPKGLDVRPTSDRVKETIFNILRNSVADAAVLDLFAGTGNLGLEAVSRGAARVVFFDASWKSLSVVKENMVHTHLEGYCEVRKIDALVGLGLLKKNQQQFDLIFCDPPYNRGLVGKVLRFLDDSDEILSPTGILIIEYSCHEFLPNDLENLQVQRTEKFGETRIGFVTRKSISE